MQGSTKRRIETMAKGEPVKWITVRGRRIPIYEGESKEDAVKRATDKDKRVEKKVNDTFTSGKERSPEDDKRYKQSAQKEIANAEENIRDLKASLKRDAEMFDGRNSAEIERRIKLWQKRLNEAKARMK